MPAPAEFLICSKSMFDLANDLMQCKLWDPSKMASPLEKEILPPTRLPDRIPFGVALPTDVHLPKDLNKGMDGYINNGMNMVLDSDDNKEIVKTAEQNILFPSTYSSDPTQGNASRSQEERWLPSQNSRPRASSPR